MPKSSKSPKKIYGAERFTLLTKRLKKRLDAFLERRPHRTLRLTRRRDYVRALELPGLFSLNHETTRLLWRRRTIFLPLMIIYILLYTLLVGIGSQETYTSLKDFLSENGEVLMDGDFGAVTQAGVTVATLAASGLNGELGETQQIFGVLLGIMVWLTTVWLLRNLLAGHKVKMRDGLYSAGAPLVSTFIIVLVILVQLLPVALAAVGYSAAYTGGLIEGGGMPAMLFWAAAVLMGLISLYWITSSLFALIIVTLPGMYPFKALRTAGDIVLGHRIKLMLRWLWMALSSGVMWILIVLPFILIDMGIKALWPVLDPVPLVPISLVLASTWVLFWACAYVYLLYRKVVDSESV